MSDDRLFASNNAIGRKWYFLNLIILAVITVITQNVIVGYFIPNATSEVYAMISKGVLYFAYIIYLVTFFALIDRRLYDIFGDRDTLGYKNVSAIIRLAIFFQVAFIIFSIIPFKQAFISIDTIQSITWVLAWVFLMVVIIIGFFKGKISCMTYEQYKKTRRRYKL